MFGAAEDIPSRASAYADRHGVALVNQLGYGKDGTVFSSNVATAIKVYARREPFEQEVACYRRLAERHVEDICGHHVPQLIACDAELFVVEMTLVRPPYLLDFAGAFLDVPPDFSDDVIEQWHEDKREQFGDRWPEVLNVVETMQRRAGIHMLDIHPGNIAFDPEPPQMSPQ